MQKTYIRTKDVFDGKSYKHFGYCSRKAIKYGLDCVKHINKDGILELHLSGPKCQFIKYYFVTISKTDKKINGLKRLISIILT